MSGKNEALGLKERLLRRTTRVGVDGVEFTIKRFSRREYIEHLEQFLRELDEARKIENQTERSIRIADINLRYERELVRLCVVEPNLFALFGERPDDHVDGVVWMKLIREIQLFNEIIPFARPTPQPNEQAMYG